MTYHAVTSGKKGNSTLIVLKHISNHERTSVVDIVKKTGLSAATVSRAVNMLERLKLILKSSKMVTSRGRYPDLFTLNDAYGYLIHFYLDVGSLQCYLFDFCGQQIAVQTKTVDQDITPQVFGKILRACEKDMLREIGQPAESVIAASIAMPGLVDRVNSRVRRIPNYPKFNNVNIFRFAEQALKIPVIVNNSARLSALGIQKCDYQEMDNIVYLDFTKQSGIGAGILINGKLLMGREGFAGEIGDILIGIEDFDRDVYDNEGCLETAASIRAMNSRLEALMRRGRAEILKKLMHEEKKNIPDLHVIENAVLQRDLDVIDVFNSIMKMWAMTIVNISSVLNPDAVILGGVVNKSNEIVLARVKHYVSKILNYDVNIELGCTDEYQMYGGLSILRDYVLDDIVAQKLLEK